MIINDINHNIKKEEFCAKLDHLDSNQAPMIQELTDYVTQMVDKMNLTFSVSMENLVHLKHENERLKKENSFLKSNKSNDGFSRNLNERNSFDIEINTDRDDNENEDGDIYDDEMEKLRKENESLVELTQKLKKNVSLLTNRISILHPKVQFLEMELEKYKDLNMTQYQDGFHDVDIYDVPHIYNQQIVTD